MKNKKLILIAACSLFTSTTASYGQSALAPSNRKPSTPTALQKYESNKSGAKLPEIASLFNWGPVALKPSLDYRFASANGLNSEDGSSRDTDIHSLVAGFNFQLGEHWSLNYNSIWTQYSNSEFTDTRDDSFNLNGWAQNNDWTLNFSQSYSSDSSTQIETGRQTNTENLSTNFGASTQLGRRSGLELGLSYDRRDAADFGGTNRLATTNWFRYENSPRLNTGVGIGLGYEDSKNGTTSNFQQILTRANLQMTQKIDLSVNFGYEFRQVDVDNSNNPTEPIYGATIGYNPFENTSLQLSVNKSVYYSIYRNSLSDRESWTFNFNQRLFGKYFFNFTSTERNTDYVTSVGDLTVFDSDKYISYNYRISTVFFEKGSIGIFYHSSENKATDVLFQQKSNQTGIDISYDF